MLALKDVSQNQRKLILSPHKSFCIIKHLTLYCLVANSMICTFKSDNFTNYIDWLRTFFDDNYKDKCFRFRFFFFFSWLCKQEDFSLSFFFFVGLDMNFYLEKYLMWGVLRNVFENAISAITLHYNFSLVRW